MTGTPEGFNTVTPTLIVANAAKAIDLYTKAFGATEAYRMNSPSGDKILHACIQLGTSKVFLCDVNPEMGCGTASISNFYLYFSDVDAIFKQAKQAGMQEAAAVQDMFWGDRTGCVKDAFGITWTLATHIRDVTPEEMDKAVQQMAGKAA